MNREHHYRTLLEWTGNTGEGTATYRGYERAHTIQAEGKPMIAASSDPSFRGDAARYNPEELFLASLSGCHMLWYLHLCSDAGVVVTAYVDEAEGVMEETASGAGRFTSVTLKPKVTVRGQSMVAAAESLHAKANEMCYIANSVNFRVHHVPEITAGE